MEAKTITLNSLLLSAAAVMTLEWAAGSMIAGKFMPSAIGLGVARLFQIGAMVLIIRKLRIGLTAVGISRSNLIRGLQKGLIWSVCFGFASALVLGLLMLFGFDIKQLFPPPGYSNLNQLLAYLVVGIMLGPPAEEFFFRGIIFGYLRKFGFVPALIISTSLFVLAHSFGSSLPITQMVGGLLFATAYEVEKNLIVPVVIHCLGNLAIFCFSLIL
jgi:membrane protease YdiL (CAAX protease family)